MLVKRIKGVIVALILLYCLMGDDWGYGPDNTVMYCISDTSGITVYCSQSPIFDEASIISV